MTKKRTPNSRFAKAGVSCFYDSEVLNSSFVHLMKFSAENTFSGKFAVKLKPETKRCVKICFAEKLCVEFFKFRKYYAAHNSGLKIWLVSGIFEITLSKIESLKLVRKPTYHVSRNVPFFVFRMFWFALCLLYGKTLSKNFVENRKFIIG